MSVKLRTNLNLKKKKGIVDNFNNGGKFEEREEEGLGMLTLIRAAIKKGL